MRYAARPLTVEVVKSSSGVKSAVARADTAERGKLIPPTTRSPGLEVVTDGVDAVVAEALPWPADASRAPAAATPLHSERLALARSAADRCTVTPATGAAPVLYQISTLVLDPASRPTGPLRHVLPAESLTDATEVVVPACTAIVATSVLPVADAIGTPRVEAAVGVPATDCSTNAIVSGGGGGGGGCGGVPPKSYVWASKVRPSEAVGVTVTRGPATLTFRKWETWG